MCFNYKVSLLTFVISFITSGLWIFYGNNKYHNENVVYGISFFFISFMQFFDFVFWIDLHNTYGINKIASIIAPIINAGAPTIFYLIKNLYYKPSFQSPTTLSTVNSGVPSLTGTEGYDSLQTIGFLIINIIYFINVAINYMKYLYNSKLVSGVDKNGHIKWPWVPYFNSKLYVIMLALNMFYLTNFKYSFSVFLITYLFLFLSWKYFSYNVGELWCFFGSAIPSIMIILTYYL